MLSLGAFHLLELPLQFSESTVLVEPDTKSSGFTFGVRKLKMHFEPSPLIQILQTSTTTNSHSEPPLILSTAEFELKLPQSFCYSCSVWSLSLSFTNGLRNAESIETQRLRKTQKREKSENPPLEKE